MIYGDNWHSGVLGIVASRILNQFFKPTIIISFENNIGVGSARSVDSINLGNINNEPIIKIRAGQRTDLNLQNDQQPIR